MSVRQGDRNRSDRQLRFPFPVKVEHLLDFHLVDVVSAKHADNLRVFVIN